MNRIKHKFQSPIRFVIVAVICMASLGWADAAQTPSVSVTVSQSSVQVAEPFSLELAVTVPVATRVVFPSTGDQLGDFDVVDTQDLFDIPDALASDKRTWTRRLTLESIVTGDLNVPSIEIQVADSNGSQVIRSKPIPVRVISVLEDRSDPTQFRDIQSVVDVAVPPPRSRSTLWWGLGGVSGLAFALALGVLVCRRKQWLTPREWALRELDELGESVESESAGTGVVAMELSAIIRDYLQLQFVISESGRTMQELIDVIESREYADQEIIKSLRALVSVADKAKFAGLELSQPSLESVLADSRAIVERISSASETSKRSSNLTETP